MAFDSYHFVTKWRVQGTARAVYELLNDVSAYPRWWPALAQSYTCVHEGDANGVGAKGEVITKGFLPYVIHWNFEVMSAVPPHSFHITANGDLVGDGEWNIQENGDMVDVSYRWSVRGKKPLLKFLSPVLRPLFSWNHTYVMKKGLIGLQNELNKRIGS